MGRAGRTAIEIRSADAPTVATMGTVRVWRTLMALVGAVACTVTHIDPVIATLPAQYVAASDVDGGGEVADPSSFAVWAVERWHGGIPTPPGTSVCQPWFPLSGSRDLPTDIEAVTTINGTEHTLWGRLCDSVPQLAWVPDVDAADVGGQARDSLIETLPPPAIALAPPAELQIVNFETWLAVARPDDVSSRPLSLPNLTLRAFATAREYLWDPDEGDVLQRSRPASDLRRCGQWTTSPGRVADGGDRPQCRWTPPWTGITTGRVTVGWDVRWEASNGTGGDLEGLTSTAGYDVIVSEVVTIGESVGTGRSG